MAARPSAEPRAGSTCPSAAGARAGGEEERAADIPHETGRLGQRGGCSLFFFFLCTSKLIFKTFPNLLQSVAPLLLV